MTAIQIKHRFTEAVLFEFEATNAQQQSGLALRHALEAATTAGANLLVRRYIRWSKSEMDAAAQ